MWRSIGTMMLVIVCIACTAGAAPDDGLKQLTNDPAQDGFPSFAPDGKNIVFSRYGRDASPEGTGLYVISVEGGEPRRLTTVIGEHPDWSPDGNYIVFDGDFGASIQLVAATGGSPVRIVPESIPVENGGQPKWSPDAARIVFKAGSGLWILEVATGRLTNIFTDSGTVSLPACWSHDGTEVYICLRAENRTASIVAVPVAGGEKRRLTPETDAVYRYADLSPDGSLLAVVFCQERVCNLWAMAAAGGPRVPITDAAGYDDGPSWSPDGRKIAFVSRRSGNFDIWTVDVDVDRLRGELNLVE